MGITAEGTTAEVPMRTVGSPRVIEPPWAVIEPIVAAGFPPINTFGTPITMVSGGPTQVHISPITAAGFPPINTVGTPGPVIGPPTCGMGCLLYTSDAADDL